MNEVDIVLVVVKCFMMRLLEVSVVFSVIWWVCCLSSVFRMVCGMVVGRLDKGFIGIVLCWGLCCGLVGGWVCGLLWLLW